MKVYKFWGKYSVSLHVTKYYLTGPVTCGRALEMQCVTSKMKTTIVYTHFYTDLAVRRLLDHFPEPLHPFLPCRDMKTTDYKWHSSHGYGPVERRAISRKRHEKVQDTLSIHPIKKNFGQGTCAEQHVVSQIPMAAPLWARNQYGSRLGLRSKSHLSQSEAWQWIWSSRYNFNLLFFSLGEGVSN